MPIGSVDFSATAPKKRINSPSGTPFTGGGCRMTQPAPAAAAARTNSTWPEMLGSATVTATGTAPAVSSMTHSISWWRSASDSLFTSLASPSTAMPWTLWRIIAFTCTRMASRDRAPDWSKSANTIG